MTARPRRLVLCADDFGQSAAIDRGILALVGQGRLGAVSCLVGGAAWAGDAPTLAALPAVRQGRVRLGLHFNLSEGRPLSPELARHWPRLPSLPRLLLLAQLRLLPRAALAAEWRAQWQAFEQAAGRPPDLIDGHQHVHHLPQVRPLLLAELAARPGLRVRDTGSVRGPGFAFKRWVIGASGGRRLSRDLAALRAQANTSLVGAYDFDGGSYRARMRAWLGALPESGAMLFCHPGAAVDEAAAGVHDPIAAARAHELAYLRSDDFAADLRRAGVQLAQLSPRSSSAG